MVQSTIITFRVQGQSIDIEEKYTAYSPFLSTLLSTKVGIERDREGYILLDLDIASFQQYVSFLQGGDFEMDEDVAALFGFMGHENRLNLDIDDWKVILQDQWIRDNMYRFHLYEDKYYGLVKIPIVRQISTYGTGTNPDRDLSDNVKPLIYTPPKGTVIAGSAALWMAGYTGKYGDVDHFFVCPKEEAVSIVSSLDEPTLNHHTVNVRRRVSYSRWGKSLKLSYVLRLYKAPTEVVHGFDVDCCSILYDAHYLNEDGTKGALFCTKRAHHAITRKVNIFNPERASPSYAPRLIKYMKRGGYRIHLPNLDKERIHPDAYDSMCKKIIEYASTHRTWDGHDYSIYGDTDDIDVVKAAVRSAKTLAPVFEKIPLDEDGEAYVIEYLIQSNQTSYNGNIYALIASCIVQYDGFNALKDILLSDPASLLILATHFSFYACIPRISDYGDTKRKEKRLPLKKKDGREDNPLIFDPIKIEWIEQDPMHQVSSTIYPSPIDDLEAWYSQSPLYQ